MKIKIITSVLALTCFVCFLCFSAPVSSHSTIYTAPNDTIASPIDWKSMDQAARKAYMKKIIMPAMRKEFRAFNAEKFENMNCGTCHGDGAEDDSYKMPNPKIYKLPRTKEGWAKADTSFMKFMRMTVKPQMASLLGLKPYSMENKDGFGCGNCHTDEEQK